MPNPLPPIPECVEVTHVSKKSAIAVQSDAGIVKAQVVEFESAHEHVPDHMTNAEYVAAVATTDVAAPSAISVDPTAGSVVPDPVPICETITFQFVVAGVNVAVTL